MDGSKSNAMILGGSIILAGLLIAFGIYAVKSDNGTKPSENNTATPIVLKNIRSITADDHILGSRDARLVIVEYSDTECPFCKDFHNTMNTIMERYKDGTDVAWVYRHFPLSSIHPKNAQRAAIASECAAELGGNDGFWEFIDRYNELTPSNDQTDFETVVPQIVEELGLDKNEFDSCLSENRYDEKITNSFNEAVASGGLGTPYNTLILKDGTQIKVPGAQPIENMRSVIDSILKL